MKGNPIPNDVMELIGTEGGTATGSAHVFDLDSGMVIRVPGPPWSPEVHAIGELQPATFVALNFSRPTTSSRKMPGPRKDCGMAGMAEGKTDDCAATGPDFLWGIEGGCWLITTEDSTYRIDLDAMTIDRHRFRDPSSTPTDDGPTRPLKEIVECKVGNLGYWLLNPEGRDIETVEYFWQRSSTVVRIDPADR